MIFPVGRGKCRRFLKMTVKNHKKLVDRIKLNKQKEDTLTTFLTSRC